MRENSQGFADSKPIPNVLGLQSQFAPLVKILAECIDELKPLSRHKTKGIEVNTREAYELLPEDLRAETIHPDKARWDEVVAKHTNEEGFVLVPISDLAAIQETARRPRLTSKQSEALAQSAQWIGYCIEPDFRITLQSYGWDDLVALFRPDADSWLPTDERYASAAVILEIGLAVTAADGVVTALARVGLRKMIPRRYGNAVW
jgi:hypothetical protein